MSKSPVPALSAVAIPLFWAAYAAAQSVSLPSLSLPSNWEQKTSNLSQLPTYAPSDLAAARTSTTGTQRSHRQGSPARAFALRQSPSQTAPSVSRLCFVPGFGWTAVAPRFSLDSNANGERPNTDNADADRLQRKSRQNASETWLQSASCPPDSYKDQSQQTSSDAPTDLFSGAAPTRFNDLNKLFQDTSVSGFGSGVSAMSTLGFSGSSQGSRIGEETDRASALRQWEALRTRAYISQIHLRRASRDLQTRLALRRINRQAEERQALQTDSAKRANSIQNAHRKTANSHHLSAMKSECEHNLRLSKESVCARDNR